jgi:hypothetical protein
MHCPECIRLRQIYEAELRRWGCLWLSPDASVKDASAGQLAELRLKAFEDRNAAKERWLLHALNCPTCKAKPNKPQDRPNRFDNLRFM